MNLEKSFDFITFYMLVVLLIYTCIYLDTYDNRAHIVFEFNFACIFVRILEANKITKFYSLRLIKHITDWLTN